MTAAVFVIGRSATDANRGLIDAVVQARHIVGSHSYSHQDLGAISADDYILDIQKGGEVIKPWLRSVPYFRYPFLRQGNTIAKRDAVLSWLLQGFRENGWSFITFEDALKDEVFSLKYEYVA